MNTKDHIDGSLSKLVALRALALRMGIPDSDLPFLALVIAQTMEHKKELKFEEVIFTLLAAPPRILHALEHGPLATLRRADSVIKANPDLAKVGIEVVHIEI